MADVPISGLTALSAQIAENDLLCYVDVSDTAQAPTGTTKKLTRAQLLTAAVVATSLTVNGTAAISGDVTVNTNKFVIDATNGNTSAAGTLQATGTITGLGAIVATTSLTAATVRTASDNAAILQLRNTAGRNVFIARNVNAATGAGSTDDCAISAYGNVIFYPNNTTTIGFRINTDLSAAVAGQFTTGDTFLARTTGGYTNGAGVGAGTLGNAPTGGNPTKWVPIDDNGTTRYIPTWT